jgi:hypothetical protein
MKTMTSTQDFWPPLDDRIAHIFKFDQLEQERQAGRTMHHLDEAPLTFRFTYKYKPGTLAQFSTKRIPAWCDRILYASISPIDVLRYSSVMACTVSDHKPASGACQPLLNRLTPLLRSLRCSNCPTRTSRLRYRQLRFQSIAPDMPSTSLEGSWGSSWAHHGPPCICWASGGRMWG